MPDLRRELEAFEGIALPDLDEDAIREAFVHQVLDRLDRAHKASVEAAQKHGEKLTAPHEEWQAASTVLVSATVGWQIALLDATKSLRTVLAECPVVHDQPEERAS